MLHAGASRFGLRIDRPVRVSARSGTGDVAHRRFPFCRRITPARIFPAIGDSHAKQARSSWNGGGGTAENLVLPCGGRISQRRFLMPIWAFCFLVGACAGIAGMALGIGMGLSQDFSLTPVHAHVNLLGWVSMMLYGLYYRGSPAAPGRLAWAQVTTATAGFSAMSGGLWLYLSAAGEAMKPVVVAGSCMSILSMALFLTVLIRNSRHPVARDGQAGQAMSGRPEAALAGVEPEGGFSGRQDQPDQAGVPVPVAEGRG